MINEWSSLLDQLGLVDDAIDETSLNKIFDWTHQHVSEEVTFQGNNAEKAILIKQYLVEFFKTIQKFSKEETFLSTNDSGGANLLHLVSMKGYDACLINLLKDRRFSGALINSKTLWGLSPLHFASLFGHERCVEILMLHGALLLAPSRLKQTPLHLALVIPPGYAPERINKKHAIFNKLMKALEGHYPDNINDLTKDIIFLLLENGFHEELWSLLATKPALVLIKNQQSRSLLHVAIMNQQNDAVAKLLAFPELLDIRDRNEQTPLHYAVIYGDVALLSILLEKTPNIDVEDGQKQTALHQAERLGKLAMVELLSNHCASVRRSSPC